LGHEDAVHSVAFDPFNDNLFLSARYGLLFITKYDNIFI
jgi:hypothetical protein